MQESNLSPTESTPAPLPAQEERTFAVALWLIDFVFTFIGPVVVWMLFRKRSALIDHHGKVCINHTISVLLLILVACLVFAPFGYAALNWYDSPWLTIGIVGAIFAVILALGIFTLVIHIIAAIKAGYGVMYVPPLCWRFMK